MPCGRLLKRYSNWFWVLVIVILLCLYYLFHYHTTNDEHSVNLKHLLAAAIYAAEQGGIQVVHHSQEFKLKSKGKTEEGAEQYVTDADFKSHCTMYTILKDLFPTIEVISEESNSAGVCPKKDKYSFDILKSIMENEVLGLSPDVYVSSKDITAWIDPLDATQEFTEHLTEYVTTMVCVAVRGFPIIGIIHKPFELNKSRKTGNTYWAWSPSNMSQNLKMYTENSSKMDMEKPHIIISRSHAGEIAHKLESVIPSTNIKAAGGAGYKVLELFKGEASVYLHITKIKKWDICAGDAILKVAGGQMTTLKNNLINYASDTDAVNNKGVLASLRRHDEFYQIFKDLL